MKNVIVSVLAILALSQSVKAEEKTFCGVIGLFSEESPSGATFVTLLVKPVDFEQTSIVTLDMQAGTFLIQQSLEQNLNMLQVNYAIKNKLRMCVETKDFVLTKVISIESQKTIKLYKPYEHSSKF
jgi:hypothetical protein